LNLTVTWGAGVRVISRGWSAAIAVLTLAGFALPANAADPAPPRIVRKAPPPPSGGKFWIEASALYWTAKGDRLPAMVTQGGTGALGSPGASVLFGNTDVADGWRPGGRVRLGYWFDPAKRSGIDAHFFMLGSASTNFNASSDGSAGSTLLGRPFLDASTNLQNSLLFAIPGVASGSISINETTRLYGAGAAYRSELCASCALGSINGFVGYRYLHLRDNLQISTNTVGLAGFLAGTSFGAADRFATSNDFHGLDLGLSGDIARGPWSLEWMTKVAVGATLTDLSISGSTAVTVGGATTVTAGGLLAQPTNIGNFGRDRFSAVPEASAKLGYQLTQNVRAFVGYDFMYWTGVVRPGGAIDTTVNSTQIGGALTGAARPLPQFNTSDYWVHGVNLGVKAAF
jgi:hypothetical protein